MHLLQAGVDMTVIAMWLGHEDIATTHQYIEADLAMKEAVLKRMDPPSSKPKIGCWTSWKGSDYAQLELRWLCSGKGAAENTPHSPDVGIDPFPRCVRAE